NHEMVNPVFADFVAGAGEVYARANYDLILSIVADGDEVKSYRQMAATGSVDGVIVHGPRTDDARIELLRSTDLPFVVHGRMPGTGLDFDFVDVDNIRAFRRATDFLLGLGHRRIALINGHEFMDFARRRHDGYRAALTAHAIPHAPDLCFSGEMSEQNGFRAARRMLAAQTPPTAFLVSSLIMAIGVRRAIHEAGLVMGRDVSVVTHDDMLSYLGNGDDRPIFTATRSSVRAAGSRCAEILLQRIADPGRAPTHEIWESELVIGTSTGPAP
ncbi:MAG: substrate-binding domain-containing protein, partial [Jannaschia sp.]